MVRAHLFHSIIKRMRRKTDPIILLRRVARPEIRLKTLIHAGAHLGQERHRYEQAGFEHVLWIEGSPTTFCRLRASFEDRPCSGAKIQHCAVCALLTDKEGEERKLRTFSNDGLSNSIFSATKGLRARKPSLTETGQSETVRTHTLDQLLLEVGMDGLPDVLVVDVQGAELLVLKGADQTLRRVKAVISEISTIPYYEGGVLYPELASFLAQYGFEPQSAPRRHGDMLFMRQTDLK